MSTVVSNHCIPLPSEVDVPIEGTVVSIHSIPLPSDGPIDFSILDGEAFKIRFS